jgi:hypothetical protein
MLTDVSLSKEQEQILRAQVIDTEHPGPILRDFQTLLDFVGPNGVKAAGKHNLLPISAISELDERLSRPLRLQLQRPQIRSHPYLQGLNLLLRATGLTQVEGEGAKARLVLESHGLERWKALNPTEQYFALMEAWLLIARPEMIGERGGGFAVFDGFLWTCLTAWELLPARGKKLDPSQPQYAVLPGTYREFYLAALMDLFGLLKVEHPSKPVHPWIPAGLAHVPFGDAVFTRLAEWKWPWQIDEDADEQPEGDEAPGFGTFRPLFQPYFPALQNSLALPEQEPRKGTSIFRVSLGPIWRRIAIRDDATLDELADAILRSVRFDDEHLYEFIFRNRLGATVHVNHPYIEEAPFTDEWTIGELPLEVGQSMEFHFDFGDDWRFDVRLESIEPHKPRARKARVLESHGAPPEQYPSWDE